MAGVDEAFGVVIASVNEDLENICGPERDENGAELVVSDRPRFQILDTRAADWVAGKILMHEAEVERRKEAAKEYIADAERAVKYLRWRFEAELAGFCRAELATQQKKAKSLKLTAGTLGFRTINPKLVVEDEKALLDWCAKIIPESVKLIPTISKEAVNEAWKRTGEVPPGCSVEDGGERFFLR